MWAPGDGPQIQLHLTLSIFKPKVQEFLLAPATGRYPPDLSGASSTAQPPTRATAVSTETDPMLLRLTRSPPNFHMTVLNCKAVYTHTHTHRSVPPMATHCQFLSSSVTLGDSTSTPCALLNLTCVPSTTNSSSHLCAFAFPVFQVPAHSSISLPLATPWFYKTVHAI